MHQPHKKQWCFYQHFFFACQSMEIGLGDEVFGGQEMQLRSSAITYNTAVSVCQETDMESCSYSFIQKFATQRCVFLFGEFLDEAFFLNTARKRKPPRKMKGRFTQKSAKLKMKIKRTQPPFFWFQPLIIQGVRVVSDPDFLDIRPSRHKEYLTFEVWCPEL